jgi:hypothetical protein
LRRIWPDFRGHRQTLIGGAAARCDRVRRVPRFARSGEVARCAAPWCGKMTGSARAGEDGKLTSARTGEDGKLAGCAASEVAEWHKQNDLRSRHLHNPFN